MKAGSTVQSVNTPIVIISSKETQRFQTHLKRAEKVWYKLSAIAHDFLNSQST